MSKHIHAKRLLLGLMILAVSLGLAHTVGYLANNHLTELKYFLAGLLVIVGSYLMGWIYINPE